MIRFLCPLCREIIASETWTPNAKVTCACCGKEVNAPESRFSPGAIIGDFLLVKKLGAGGMGIVFKAHQLSLDRPAAIKVLNPEYSKEADSVQAFIREARSAAKLNHPNIVQAYAVGEDEGIFYFAMEFIDGETMKETLQSQGKIEFKEAAKAIMQVADGLDTAWKEQKLIHHDIKPDNIMQCSNHRYKLADLGLSQVFGEDANDDSNEVLGTPQYISPEQLTGVMTDTRSDIYSLGATFYHLVTGQFPYNGKDTDEIARQHVYGTLVPPNKVNPMLPPELNSIIVKMMAKEPEKRYQNCGEVVKALEDYLEGKHSSGGLSGGMSGGMSASLSGGMSGSSSAPTLNPGGSGASLRLGGGASQAQTIMPPSHSQASLKLSGTSAAASQPVQPAPAGAPQIKIALKKPAAPAETPEAAAPAPETPAATPEAAAPAPVINLKRPAEAPAPEDPKAEAPAPEAEAPKSEEPEEEAPAPEPAAEEVKGKKGKKDKKDKKSKKDAKKPEDKPETEKKDGGKSDAGKDKKTEDASGEEKKDAQKPEKSSGAITWAIVLGALVLGGAFIAYTQMTKKEVKTPVATRTQIKRQTAEIEIPDATIQEYANGAPVEPEKAPEPVLSEFERESKRLLELSMSDPAQFVREWRDAANSLSPENDKDRETLADLEITYINLDEKLNIAPARESMIRDYQSAAAQKLLNDKQNALAAKIAAEDAKDEKRAAESPLTYKEDLKRKVMLLDHAMIRAARSGKEEDWNAFNNLIDKAFQEPKLYANDAERKEIAEALAVYANELATVADQGRAFTAFLEANKAGGHTLKMGKGSVTIDSTTKDSITYSLTMPDGTSDSGTLNLRTDSPRQMCAIADTLGMAAGRSHQFFYYMVYNGFLKEDLAFAAPSTFWKQNVGHVIGNYFRRAIFTASEEELKALRNEFGEWRAFQWAEKKQP